MKTIDNYLENEVKAKATLEAAIAAYEEEQNYILNKIAELQQYHHCIVKCYIEDEFVHACNKLKLYPCGGSLVFFAKPNNDTKANIQSNNDNDSRVFYL